jgi:hypothetical protein
MVALIIQQPLATGFAEKMNGCEAELKGFAPGSGFRKVDFISGHCPDSVPKMLCGVNWGTRVSLAGYEKNEVRLETFTFVNS